MIFLFIGGKFFSNSTDLKLQNVKGVNILYYVQNANWELDTHIRQGSSCGVPLGTPWSSFVEGDE